MTAKWPGVKPTTGEIVSTIPLPLHHSLTITSGLQPGGLAYVLSFVVRASTDVQE